MNRITVNFKLFNSGRPPVEKDVRALKEFLFSNKVQDELALHALLERHPALIGVLGFSEFVSEHPLYKRGEDNKPVLLDRRRRDRADFVAAKTSTIQPPPGLDFYKSAHVIELKSATMRISMRGHGTRISDEASLAIGQLRDYKEWLTTVQENRALFEAIGWDIRVPMLYLVMGTTSEFTANPGHLDELKGRFQELGVCLVTVDELLSDAERQVREKQQLSDVIRWAVAPTKIPGEFSPKILAEIEEVAFLHPTAVEFRRSLVPEFSHYRQYLLHLRHDFFGLCAYCRTPDRLAGGPLAFGVDHFRPKSRFLDLSMTYENLYYVCHGCNMYKGPKWPSAAEQKDGYRFIDPIVDRFQDHIQEADDCTWIARTHPAEYTISHLRLNRESLLEIRHTLRRLASEVENI